MEANKKGEDPNLLAQKVMLGKKYTHTFDIHYEDGVGVVYEGKFTVKRPTIGDKMAIGIDDAARRGGLAVDLFTSNLSYMIATLVHVVVDSPPWFIKEKIEELFDYDLVDLIFKQYVEWNNQFFRRSKPENGGDKDIKPLGNDVDADAVGGSGDKQ